MSIFELKKLRKPNFIQTLLKKEPKENAIIKINNIFYNKENEIEKINKEEIDEIIRNYNISGTKVIREKENIFLKVLRSQVDKNKIERKILNHIIDILGLSKEETYRIINEYTSEKYEKYLRNIFNNGEDISAPSEETKKLQKDLEISDDKEYEIYYKVVSEGAQKILDDILKDERLSPEEDKKFNEMLVKYNIDAKYDDETQRRMELYRYYWQIENETIPIIESDINLPKTENLYFVSTVEWYENRTQTKTIRYSGPVISFRIAKGIYWRSGNLRAEKVSEDVLKHIDSGNMYITNKRIIFIGTKGSKNIKLEKILDMIPYNNGLNIIKDTGKPVFLEIDEDSYVASMILYRLIKEK